MGKRKIEKSQLLERTGYLLRIKGYAGTSMKEIGRLLGIDKASLYHYFPSKQALTLAVLDAEQQRVNEQVLAIVRCTEIPPYERALQFAEAVEAYFLQREGGCLMANLCAEVAHQIPEFGQRIKHYFDEWHHAITALNTLNTVEPQFWVEDFMAQIQGHVMLYTLFKDKSALRRQLAKLCQG